MRFNRVIRRSQVRRDRIDLLVVKVTTAVPAAKPTPQLGNFQVGSPRPVLAGDGPDDLHPLGNNPLKAELPAVALCDSIGGQKTKTTSIPQQLRGPPKKIAAEISSIARAPDLLQVEFPTKSGQGVNGFSVRTPPGTHTPATSAAAGCCRRPRCTRRSPPGPPPAWRSRRRGPVPSSERQKSSP
jgi:hypothetical protein